MSTMIGMVDGSGSIFSAAFQLWVSRSLKYMFIYYAGTSHSSSLIPTPSHSLI